MRLLVMALCALAIVIAEPANADQPSPQSSAQPSGQNLSVPFPLPATFQGTTACADCPGIRVVITLNADGSYLLEREYLERPSKSRESGHWSFDRSTNRLTLFAGGDAAPEFFAVAVNPTLQPLDASGKPLPTSADFAYAPWLTFGDMPLPLEATRWRASTLAGSPVHEDNAHAPRLQFDAIEKRLSGTAGCNRISGTYEATGATLRLGPVAATRMGCDAAAMSVENAFLSMLAKVASYTIDNGGLTLYAADGSALASFVAEKP